MDIISCCFAGHRNTPQFLAKEVLAAIESLLSVSDGIRFYSGGMGDFDKLCEQSVREAKKNHPDKDISLYWVLPSYQYVPEQEELSYLCRLYDDIFVCDFSDGAHYKDVIGKRNRWIVEQSDYMIAYVICVKAEGLILL